MLPLVRVRQVWNCSAQPRWAHKLEWLASSQEQLDIRDSLQMPVLTRVPDEDAQLSSSRTILAASYGRSYGRP